MCILCHARRRGAVVVVVVRHSSVPVCCDDGSGLGHCAAPVIVRLDADDVMVTGSLRPRLQYMTVHGDVDVMGGAVVLRDGDCERVLAFPRHPALVKWAMLMYCCIAHPTVIAKREV